MKNAPKGQWKRLAHMQGQLSTTHIAQTGDKLEDLVCRRRQKMTEAGKDEPNINNPAKKGKVRRERKSLNNVEVEETSLN